MATEHQINFVKDMEAALKALEAQGVIKPKIGQLMDHAGQNPAGLHAMVTRLKEHKERDLVSRLRAVFEKSSKMPVCLEDVKPPKEEKSLDSMAEELNNLGTKVLDNIKAHEGVSVKLPLKLGGTVVQSKRFDGSPIHSLAPDPIETLNTVLQLFARHSKQEREHIHSSAGMFYGIGQ